MSLTISHIVNSLIGKNKRILVLGLQAAGKTSFLKKLKLGDNFNTISTMGVSIKTVEHNGISVVVSDVGELIENQTGLRHYFQSTNGIIFMVDAHNRETIGKSRVELQKLMEDEMLIGVPLLILANKQDLPDALDREEVTDKLGLHGLRGRSWFTQPTCVLNEDGLYDGVEWLIHYLKN